MSACCLVPVLVLLALSSHRERCQQICHPFPLPLHCLLCSSGSSFCIDKVSRSRYCCCCFCCVYLATERTFGRTSQREKADPRARQADRQKSAGSASPSVEHLSIHTGSTDFIFDLPHFSQLGSGSPLVRRRQRRSVTNVRHGRQCPLSMGRDSTARFAFSSTGELSYFVWGS